MPPESGGSQFLDTGTAVGLFTLAIVLILKTILPYFVKPKATNSSSNYKNLEEQLKVITTSLAKLTETINELYKWHEPKLDDQGHYKFLWYGDWICVKKELQEQREILNGISKYIEEEKKLED